MNDLQNDFDIIENMSWEDPDTRKQIFAWIQLATKRLEEMHELVDEYKIKVADAEASERRWANQMRDMQNRYRHAEEVLSGRIDVPAINELRKVQGLEELPQLGYPYRGVRNDG